MPATPAWPPKSLPRLFVREELGENVRLDLDAGQANYLGNVMRLGEGAEVLLFDGNSGEWLGRIAEAGKKRMALRVERRTREPERIPDVWLAFAPVKRTQTDWLVEKATELGVATEQCGRTRLPEIVQPVPLAQMLKEDGRTLYFADEAGGAPAASAFKPGPATILTGPEGGFTEEERAKIRAVRHAVPISLGPRILRAETAALASLAAYMALAGDWR